MFGPVSITVLLKSVIFCSAVITEDCDDPYTDLVDLGYAKHIPTWLNTTSHGTQILNYNNIRYAQLPIGSKRFRKPVAPPLHQKSVQNGNRSSWETDCISSATKGVPFPLLSRKTWGSEDCLFLNVVVSRGAKEGDTLPVLHWNVVSAFAFGGKDWTGFGINTYGLFNRPLNLTDQFIIVTHKYSLGISGWLPKLEQDMNGNLGVWDSLAAMEWAKKYIHKFGGDPNQITAIGQSAGASILSFLLIGEEGNLSLQFDRAMISSPALPPRNNLERARPVFEQILNAIGCDTVHCMRQIPEAKLRDANAYLFSLFPDGGGGALGPGIGLSPLVDGELVSELPATAFVKGRINKGIKSLIVGNTAAEVGLGLSSDRDMPARFPVLVRANIPNISKEGIAKLQAMYDFPREIPEKLALDYTTDIIFGCSARNIAEAYGEKARRYLFSVPPACHGQEIAYFFFADSTTTPMASFETAYAAQNYLLQFMFREDFPANPQALYTGLLSGWPTFAPKATIANTTAAGFEFGLEVEVIKGRCAYINDLIIDPANGV